MSERVAIVGSRGWKDLEAVRAFVRSLPRDTEVVSGGADGVDITAEKEAKRLGMEPRVLRPDYIRYGHVAPKVRNKRIAEICDRMVAFWDGDSPGTANAVTWAVALGKPVEVRRHG